MGQVPRLLRISLVALMALIGSACGTSPTAPPIVAQTPASAVPATPATLQAQPVVVMTFSPFPIHVGAEGHVTLQLGDVTSADTATVDFGDGTQTATGAAMPSTDLTHIYATPGTYTVTATVTTNSTTVRGTLAVQVNP
jgi:PKD repeat protein